jgi:hypothetical protein
MKPNYLVSYRTNPDCLVSCRTALWTKPNCLVSCRNALWTKSNCLVSCRNALWTKSNCLVSCRTALWAKPNYLVSYRTKPDCLLSCRTALWAKPNCLVSCRTSQWVKSNCLLYYRTALWVKPKLRLAWNWLPYIRWFTVTRPVNWTRTCSSGLAVCSVSSVHQSPARDTLLTESYDTQVTWLELLSAEFRCWRAVSHGLKLTENEAELTSI